MIYVLIPVFNRIRFTINCINSILNQDLQSTLRIVVVDDGSSDGTSVLLKQIFGDKIVILQGTGKLYWTGAIHFGISYILAKCNVDDYILLVNNDVVLAQSAIQNLLSLSSKENDNLVVGSVSIDPTRNLTIKSGTIVKSWFLNLSQHVYMGVDQDSLVQLAPINVDFITARCLLHPVKVFLCSGIYDSETFIHYGADDEFSMRIKKYGFDVVVCPSSVVYMQGCNDNPSKCSSLSVWHALFSVRSSSNILNKYRLCKRVVPIYARPTYMLVGILKSLIVAIGQNIESLATVNRDFLAHLKSR